MFLKSQSEFDRLATWRKFRHTFPKDGTATDVVKAFEDVKLSTRYLDYYSPDNWPDVFEIVKHGMFCQSGITLVIANTLLHLGFVNSRDLRFDVVSNHITGSTGLIFIDNKLCYNFLPGEVVSEEFVEQNSTRFGQHIIASDKFPC